MFSLGGYLGKWIWEVEAMPARELIRYMAMYEIDPFGEMRDDLRAGCIAATQYNLQRGRGAKAMKIADFLPDFAPKKRQTAQDMANLFGMFAEATNARITDGKSN